MLAPKAAGTHNLLAVAAAAPLGGVALFSSIAALLGNAGQSNYTAANALLDANATAAHAQVCIHPGTRVLHDGKRRRVAGLAEKPLVTRMLFEWKPYCQLHDYLHNSSNLGGEWGRCAGQVVQRVPPSPFAGSLHDLFRNKASTTPMLQTF